jgi:hypothetical protein
MQSSKAQIEHLVERELLNPEQSLRYWISEYKRLEQAQARNEEKVRVLTLELEIGLELLGITCKLLEKAMGADADLAVLRIVAEHMGQPNKSLH